MSTLKSKTSCPIKHLPGFARSSTAVTFCVFGCVLAFESLAGEAQVCLTSVYRALSAHLAIEKENGNSFADCGSSGLSCRGGTSSRTYP